MIWFYLAASFIAAVYLCVEVAKERGSLSVAEILVNFLVSVLWPVHVMVWGIKHLENITVWKRKDESQQ